MEELSFPRKLNVDLDELARIFDSNEPLISYYLDLEDGQIIQVTEDTRLHLNSIYDEYLDEDQEEIEMLSILDGLDLSDWERQELQDAHRVEMGFGERYLRVPLPSRARVTRIWRSSSKRSKTPA